MVEPRGVRGDVLRRDREDGRWLTGNVPDDLEEVRADGEDVALLDRGRDRDAAAVENPVPFARVDRQDRLHPWIDLAAVHLGHVDRRAHERSRLVRDDGGSGRDVRRDDHASRESIPAVRHLRELRRAGQGDDRAVGVGDEPEAIRSGTDSAEPPDDPERRPRFLFGFDRRADEVGGSSLAADTLDVGLGRSGGAQELADRRAVDSRVVEQVQDIDDLTHRGGLLARGPVAHDAVHLVGREDLGKSVAKGEASLVAQVTGVGVAVLVFEFVLLDQRRRPAGEE